MRYLALCMIILCGGCGIDLSVPQESTIACGIDQDCPVDWLCNQNTGKCVSLGDPDTEPPSILPPVTLEPTTARVAALVTLTFATSEELQELEIFFESGGSRYDFVHVGSTNEEPPLHTMTYTPTGLEPEGSHVLMARVSDGNDNELSASLGAALSLDFTSPAVVEPVSVQAEPAITNPLTIATSLLASGAGITYDAKTDSRVRVELSTSESLDPVDQIHVVIVSGSSQYSLLFIGMLAGSLIYEMQVEEGTPEGDYELQIELVDAAGNVGSMTLPAALTVDNTSPSAPDVVGDGAMVYSRAPWGTHSMGSGARFWLEAAADAVEAGSVLVASSGSDGAVVAAAVADGLNPTTVLLPPYDATEVFVRSLDRAGNASAPLRIDEVRWIASMGNKIAGSSVENPNQFFASPVWSASMIPGGATEAGARQGLAQATCEVSCEDTLTTAGLGYWEPIAATWPFLPKYEVAMAYYPTDQSIVAFGGRDSLYRSQPDFWVWDGSQWDDPYISGAFPEHRHGASLAYDDNLGKMVLFGGYQSSGPNDCVPKAVGACGDTWAWNGSVWEKLTATGPAGRAKASLAFDYQRDRLILYGGTRGATEHDDTWALNCSNLPCSWSLVAPGKSGPPVARSAAGMVWDQNDARLVLFGGKGDYDARLSDVWTLTSTGWQQLSAGLMPPRIDHRLVYDPTRRDILSWGVDILFGSANDQTTCGRPWVLTESSLRCPASASPYGVVDLPETSLAHAIYYPPLEGTLVVGAEHGTDAHLWHSGSADKPSHTVLAAFGLAVGGSNDVLVERINFQPADALTPLGYLAQGTEPYGMQSDGRSYGWTCSDGSAPEVFDDNEPASPDQRHDTYVQMRYVEQVFVEYDCAWEMAVADGNYRVRAMVGSPRAEDVRRHTLQIEGIAAVDETPDVGYPWLERVVDVTVSDGRLTVGSGATNTRLAFVEIIRPTPIREIVVEWLAGATGAATATNDVGLSGVDLFAYRGDSWVAIDEGTGSTTAPQWLRWSSGSAAEASALLTGQSRILGLSVAPKGFNGLRAESAGVTSDYVQAMVHYRVSEVNGL